MPALERFIKYAKIDTQADENSHVTPSSEKEKNLGRVLVEDLKQLGLSDAFMDEWGNVYAHKKGATGAKIGLNAHMDTALEVTDENVNPRIVEKWNGEDIKLNDEYKLSVEQFPGLKKHIGKDLVVTDGNTLLGADDKAGIAIIMGALEYFAAHPEVKHHPISVCFTVDEEIGEGPDHFSLEKMDADFAYTVDGSDINQVDYINFNAQGLVLKIQGVAVHPGEGKNQLINAILLMNEFIAMMPQKETPFDANEDEGYWHINDMTGTNDVAECHIILREFDKDKLLERDEFIKNAISTLQNKYPKAKFEYKIFDQYFNMEEYVKADPRPLEKAFEAIKKNGLNPISSKIRGGTDGASFSRMGLVTPNLGTGSYNHHGRFEYLVVQDFLKMMDIVVDILKI